MRFTSESLPLDFDHIFYLWSYQKSHSKLTLRGRPGEQYTDFVDLVFSNVLAMKTVPVYPRLSVVEKGIDGEIDAFLEIPERHADKFMKLRISDGVHDGFVVCQGLYVHRGSGWHGQETGSGSATG
jgi:hypothetical protein